MTDSITDGLPETVESIELAQEPTGAKARETKNGKGAVQLAGESGFFMTLYTPDPESAFAIQDLFTEED